jgi:hypothetical protein
MPLQNIAIISQVSFKRLPSFSIFWSSSILFKRHRSRAYARRMSILRKTLSFLRQTRPEAPVSPNCSLSISGRINVICCSLSCIRFNVFRVIQSFCIMYISFPGAGFVPYRHYSSSVFHELFKNNSTSRLRDLHTAFPISSDPIPEGTGGKMSHNFTGYG